MGKRLCALAFIKTLNCTGHAQADDQQASLLGMSEPAESEVDPTEACGQCPSCRKLESGSHPDFKIVEPEAGIIKVEQIREVEEVLSLKPFEGRLSTVIIDRAECMNQSAANAFLKTLEEPSPYSLIVLISSRPDWLPITIRSRCLRVNFSPLGEADTDAVLKRATRGAHHCGALSMGRPGICIDRDLAKERKKFLASLAGAESDEGGKAPWKDREDIEQWLDMALVFLRDLYVVKVTKREGSLINKDMASELAAMSRGASVQAIMQCYAGLMEMRGRLQFNLNKGIAWNRAMTLFEGLNVNGQHHRA